MGQPSSNLHRLTSNMPPMLGVMAPLVNPLVPPYELGVMAPKLRVRLTIHTHASRRFC